AHPGGHRAARRGCVRGRPARRRPRPGAHAVSPDRGRGQLPDRGAAGAGDRRRPLPVALGRPRRARPVPRRRPGGRGVAARRAGRLSRTMHDMEGPLTTAVAWGRAALRAPFGHRARSELLFCLAGVPLGLGLAVVVAWLMAFAAVVALLSPRFESTWVAAVAIGVGAVLAVVLAPWAGPRLGGASTRTAGGLAGGTRCAAPGQ